MSEFTTITVKGLIAELKTFNPDAEVLLGAEGQSEIKRSWLGAECNLNEIMCDETKDPLKVDTVSLYSWGINNWATRIST